MPWIMLAIAGLLEVVFAISLRNSEGFTKPLWVLAFAVSAAASLFLLSQALKYLPVGVAYAVWTGIGASGTAIIGMWFFGESRDVLKLVSLAVLLIGIAGLQISSSAQH